MRNPTVTHLSIRRVGVADLLGHRGQYGHQPGLPVELVAEPPSHAAQQRRQQVLVAPAELAVLQGILQKPV